MKNPPIIHPDAALNAKILALTGGGGGSEPPTPQNYQRSNAQQRNNWNTFLDFLAKKGMGGSPELDKRDRTRGLELLNEFNKANPANKVDPSFLPVVQYESTMIRRHGRLPGFTQEQNEYLFKNLADKYKNYPTSKVDNWLGSHSSQQYYPRYKRQDAGKPDMLYDADYESLMKTIPTKERTRTEPNSAASTQFRSGGYLK